ncbi:MAG: exopolyphosphatase, partial [Candidatus Cloacimonadota bacterium]|nr:exopolyphosphatase [Candidatus Cloacimonadota bacterium]
MRLVTRSDFDGLACAAILNELGVIDEIFYSHPKDIQDGIVGIKKTDILANVPFVKGCGMWFDHHSSETERLELQGEYEGLSEKALSAAQVVFDY